MQKYLVVLFIAIGWLGIDLCSAQNTASKDGLNTTGTKTMDSITVFKMDLRLERGLANFLRALQHHNEGVVESAMINLLKMKYHYPGLDYGKVITLLQDLESSGRSQSIRFMAFITGRCLEDANTLSLLQEGDHEFALKSEFVFRIVQK